MPAVRSRVFGLGAVLAVALASLPGSALATGARSRSSAVGVAAAANGGGGLAPAPAAPAAPSPGAASLVSAARPQATAHPGQRTLREGMRGREVRLLQRSLTVAGFPTTADGAFGPGTRRSLVGFEQAHGLRPDGVLTPAQARVLRAVAAEVQTSSPQPVGPAMINPNGTATAPQGAPAVVRQVIAAANQIIDTRYHYGGGHAQFDDSGYDCSGAVSYALHGGGLLSWPEDSSGLETYGRAGPGQWITVYANPGHTWVVVAGIAFDTADYGGPNIPSGTGPRWRRDPTGNLRDGGHYVVRHPAGL